MRKLHINREFGFLLNDVARMLRTYADQEARHYGMTRAQWAVLARLERHEGIKQAELAEMLDIQPITLTRLVDRLCDSGLIERRADPNDRRAKRLFLTRQAKPVMDRLDSLATGMLADVLAGLDAARVKSLIADLGGIRENLRRILSARTHSDEGMTRYG
ncbi:MAG TPA: MarR family transcriptional regulator [Pseudorhodoplanes sp.]|nr:MarR family transcriptional regulator [Pseudorhodoplanes sp.]